jgi:hypothetical protein
MHFGRVADVLSASYAVNDSFSHLGAGMRSLWRFAAAPPNRSGFYGHQHLRHAGTEPYARHVSHDPGRDDRDSHGGPTADADQKT